MSEKTSKTVSSVKRGKAIHAESLRHLHLFKGCSLREIDICLKSFCGSIQKMSKGEIVIQEGADAKWMMVVLKGTLDLYDALPDRERELVRVFEPGGFLGMSLAMGKVEYYPCVIIAGADTEILMLDSAKIRENWYRPGFQKFYENLFECFSDYVRFCRDKIKILNLRDAEDRIMHYLQMRAEEVGTKEFSVPFANSQMMAEFLGITRTSLSRSVAKLEREGKIRHLGKKKFCVSD